MQTACSTQAYLFRLFWRGKRYLLPLAVFLFVPSLVYRLAPAHPVDGYAFSITLLCFCMSWVGFSFTDLEDPVSMQLRVLKGKGLLRCLLHNSFCLVWIGAVFALMGVLLPLLFRLLNGPGYFSPALRLGDVGYALLLHWAAALLGGALGAFFHPWMIADRKWTVFILLFLLTGGFVRVGIPQAWPWTRYVTWLLPPISSFSEFLTGAEHFTAGNALPPCFQCLAYALVLEGIRLPILLRKRFP